MYAGSSVILPTFSMVEPSSGSAGISGGGITRPFTSTYGPSKTGWLGPCLPPNTYDEELNTRLAASSSHEYRIYLNTELSEWALVSEEDYPWASLHCWCLKVSRGWKKHARRAVGTNANGERIKTVSLYLHVEVMKRTGCLPPCEAHSLVDHLNGDGLDCRRNNLRWATHSMNVRNKHGIAAKQLGLSI